jgi:hypothetical protein
MSMRRGSLGAVLVGFFCASLLAPAAQAAAAQPPRTALLEAQSKLHPLASQASPSSAQGLAADAVRKLAQATFASLWIDARHADAPSYGTRIFTYSIAALTDLQRLAGSPTVGASPAIGLIVGADRGLAEGAISQARGGSHGLLAAARRDLAAGDRDAAADHPASAVRSYTKAWADAFTALAKLVAAKITSVPSSELSAAAENALGSSKIGLAGPMILPAGRPPLTLAGKPEVFYAGSEACPFCGVQRWGMIVALSQFGTFSNLALMQSSSTERPQVRTFTFFGSSYQSPYIAFVPVEVISNVPKGFGFAHLQRLTPFERALLNNFDPPQQVPFIDVANRFARIDSTVQPSLVGGRSWTQLASSLKQPASIPAQAIAGGAEVLTAEICEATGGNPNSVCSAPVVKDYEAALPLLNGRGGGCPISQTASAARSPKYRGRRGGTPVARAAHCKV